MDVQHELRIIVIVLLSCLVVLTPTVRAQVADHNDPSVHDGAGSPEAVGAEQGPARTWTFLIAPYGWLAGTGGTVVIDGEETEVDASFSDLAARTRGGFQLYFEARHGKWFVAFDGTWATLGEVIEGLITTTDVEVEQRIYDIHAGYEAFWKYLGEPSPEPRMSPTEHDCGAHRPDARPRRAKRRRRPTTG